MNYRPSLDPLTSKVRSAFKKNGQPSSRAVPENSLILLGVSGGADSLALAHAASYFNDQHKAGNWPWRYGAIIIDHHIIPETTEVSFKTASTLLDLGLDPVIIDHVTVEPEGEGLEACARNARYEAFEKNAHAHNAAAIMTAHTHDDQAEQVLLGLVRGSGTKTLSGIAQRRFLKKSGGYSDGKFSDVELIRPFLGLKKTELEQFCAVHHLEYWNDPANYNPQFLRSHIRQTVLPWLEEELPGNLSSSLVRTARIAADDNLFIDQFAHKLSDELAVISPGDSTESLPPGGEDTIASWVRLSFPLAVLHHLDSALRHRLYCLLDTHLLNRSRANFSNKSALTFERICAIDDLVDNKPYQKIIQSPSAQGTILWTKTRNFPSEIADKLNEHISRKENSFFYPELVKENSHQNRLAEEHSNIKNSYQNKNKLKDIFSSAKKYGTLEVWLKTNRPL